MSFTGLLPLTCNIQELSTTENDSGQHVESWSNVATNVACRLDPTEGGVTATPREVYDVATHIVCLRQQAGLTLAPKTHRIVISSINYNIALVSTVYGLSDVDHLEVILEKVE